MTANSPKAGKTGEDRRFDLYLKLDGLEELLEDMAEAGVQSEVDIVEQIEAINRKLDELEQDS